MKISFYTVLALSTLAVIVVGTYAHIETEALHAFEKRECSIAFNSPNITARAAYVYDLKTGEALFSKNAEAQLPLASLTKVTTALVAARELDTTGTLSITENALTPEGDSGFFAGEVWEINDLIDFTLITSSNDGARALALQAGDGSAETFVNGMNRFVKEIGTRQTFFLNETGLDLSSTTAGAYGSARDMSILLSYAYEEDQDVLIGSTHAANVFTSLSGFQHPAEHTSDITGTIPGELIVKTGFTDLAGGNLVVLSEIFPGRPVAFVVLGAERETRDSDIQLLVQSAKQNIKHATLCDK